MHFYFFRIGHLGQFCLLIWSVALCVELTEFLDNIFKMSIFKLKLNFFKILNISMVKNPEKVLTI